MRMMNRLRGLFRRRADQDLSREIEAHIAERVDDLVDSGMNEAAARTQARREFGNARLQVERSREVWVGRWLTSIRQDLRYAVRSLARQPGFTLSAVGILAIGIGLVTAFVTILNPAVLRPWPVHDPTSLAIVRARPAAGQQFGTLSNVEYRYLREHSRSFTQLAAWMPGSGRVTYGVTTANVQSNFVSANYFDTLRVRLAMGRSFLPDEEDYTTPQAVAVISERLWREIFGAPASIIGSTILINERPFVVVGVASPGFFDVARVRRDVWMPLPALALQAFGTFEETLKGFNDPRGDGPSVVGRLAAGVPRETARAEIELLGRQFRQSNGVESQGFSLHTTRPLNMYRESVARELPAAGLLGGALLAVMLLACANVGNLILARGLSRQREIAVRLSLGASRMRVARQLLVETLVLTAISGAIGLMLSVVAVVVAMQVINRVPGDVNLLVNPTQYVPDVLVYGLTLALAAVACLAAGLMPALRSTSVNLAMRAGTRSASRAGAGRLRTIMLATQLALSMVLLVGAGLFTRAIGYGLSFDTGFAIRDVQVVTFTLPDANADRRMAFDRSLRDSLSAVDLTPHAFGDFSAITANATHVSLRRADGAREVRWEVIARPVSTHYFAVTGIPLVAGRSLEDLEHSREAVINETAARIFWPDESPLGRRLLAGSVDSPRAYDIVGVARDVPVTSLTSIQPVIYWRSGSARFLFVRDASSAVVDRVTSIAHAIEPRVQVAARPLADDIGDSLSELTISSRLAWATGLLALVLATTGAFGVFAYMVEERRREIGVRMALGAQPRQLVWTVIGGARRPLMFGLGAGLVLSLVAAPLLRSFLYGLSPFDPVTYAGISVILIVAALLATWIPARRATRVDPAITLRAE